MLNELGERAVMCRCGAVYGVLEEPACEMGDVHVIERATCDFCGNTLVVSDGITRGRLLDAEGVAQELRDLKSEKDEALRIRVTPATYGQKPEPYAEVMGKWKADVAAYVEREKAAGNARWR